MLIFRAKLNHKYNLDHMHLDQIIRSEVMMQNKNLLKLVLKICMGTCGDNWQQ